MALATLLSKTRRVAWMAAESYGVAPAVVRSHRPAMADLFRQQREQGAVALAGAGGGLVAPSSGSSQTQSLAELCGSIWLMAVPKQKRSLRVRRTRWNNPANQIKAKHHITRCPNCGSHKMRHRTCQSCGFYGDKVSSRPKEYEWAK